MQKTTYVIKIKEPITLPKISKELTLKEARLFTAIIKKGYGITVIPQKKLKFFGEKAVTHASIIH